MSEGLTAPAPSGAAAPVLRLSAVALGLAVAAAVLPQVPASAAALLCGGLGLVLALPAAADAALRRGHSLSRYAEGSLARRVFAGPALRLGLAVAVGTGLAAVLLVRLSAGGAGVWAIAALAALASALVLRLGVGPARTVWAGAHARAGARWLAQWAGAVAAVLGAVLVGRSGALPDPSHVPATVAALTDEIYALHRLWAGAEAWLLGQAVALSVIPAWAAVALVLLGNAAIGWAVARLTVAALMSPADLRRAFAAASDSPVPPPPSVAGVSVAAAVVAVAVAAGAWAEARLVPLPPEARPVARVQLAADRIGEAFYRPGTAAAIMAARDDLARTDADLAARLRIATDEGFDRVVANVDPFLDGYYSLWGEYARMIDWSFGRLEERLSERLAEALAEGAPFAELEALRAEVEALRDATLQVSDEPQALAGARLPAMNPGEVRVGAALAVLPAPPDLRTTGLTTTFEVRAGVSLAAGAVGAVVAGQVVRRLAARGAISMAARAVPLIGLAVALGVDWAAVELEEAMHRDAFRADIVAAIEEQRRTALAVFD